MESATAKIGDVPVDIAVDLRRAYAKQDELMFATLVDIYKVARTIPSGPDVSAAAIGLHQVKIDGLRAAYGDRFVEIVMRNIGTLSGIDSIGSDASVLSRINPAVLSQLRAVYEQRSTGREFMPQFLHLITVIPTIYSTLNSGLSINASGPNFLVNLSTAVSAYESEFGNNNYLFRQYVSVAFLSRKLGISIQSPRQLYEWMGTSGLPLMLSGRSLLLVRLQQDLLSQYQTPGANFVAQLQAAMVLGSLNALDAVYLGLLAPRLYDSPAFGPQAAASLLGTLQTIVASDRYLVGPFLMDVLPALLDVCEDQKTLVTVLGAFGQWFASEYAQGMTNIAYSTLPKREYFMKAFERVGSELAKAVTTFDHYNLGDMTRLTPEAKTEESYYNPRYYGVRPPRALNPDQDIVPRMYGNSIFPLRLLPTRIYPRSPSNSGFVPGGFAVDSGVAALLLF
ncbi:hypothetical protein HZC07_00840 [Candidatus Micrarchaeota archaeon]|nr:hypothetical protein [Candidatus Micrarchaeota archaeon]